MSILENLNKILDPRDLSKVNHSLSNDTFRRVFGLLDQVI